jgi:hypothetical protein
VLQIYPTIRYMSNATFFGATALALAFLTFSAHGQSTVLPTTTSVVSSSTNAELPQRLGALVVPEEVAAYYDDSHKDLKFVLAGIQETNALSPQSWSFYAEARIRMKLKDYQGARVAAERSKQLALEAAPLRDNYAALSQEVLAEATTLLASSGNNQGNEDVVAQNSAVNK